MPVNKVSEGKVRKKGIKKLRKTGMMTLQAKEKKELLKTVRSQKRGTEQILSHNLQKERTNLADADFRLLASKTE